MADAMPRFVACIVIGCLGFITALIGGFKLLTTESELASTIGGVLVLGAIFTIPVCAIVGLVFVVRVIFAPRKRPAWECRRCRYDLRGLTTGICPECGLRAPVRRTVRRASASTSAPQPPRAPRSP